MVQLKEASWCILRWSGGRGDPGLRTTQNPEWGDGSASEEDFAGNDLQSGDSVCQFSPLRVSEGTRLATEGAGREVQTDIFRAGQSMEEWKLEEDCQ